MGEPIASKTKQSIYIIERGIMMNGIEMHYDNVHYSSTFEEAVKYVQKEFKEFKCYGEEVNSDEQFVLNKVNDNYWSVELDFESKLGILTVELDKEL